MTLYLRMAWRSLRRSRGLNVVMIGALALGIATWYAQRQIFAFLASKMPAAAPRDLYLVALERGPSATAITARDQAPLWESILLAPRDAQALLAGSARRHTITFGAFGLIEPGDQPAQTVRVRYATRELFALFAIPLVEGAPWPVEADQGIVTDAAVIDESLARQLFGSGPSVGRRLRVDGADLRVVGVVAARHNRRFHLYERFVPTPDAVYLPVAYSAAVHAASDFSYPAGDETGSVTAWVELPTEAARAELVAHAEAYLARERARGREAAPRALTLHSAARWGDVYASRGTIMLWPLLSGMCLATCIVNLLRMLFVKFAGRRHDLGLLRAFGAPRRAVMGELLLEAALIGLLAGGVGLLLGVAMMPLATGTVAQVGGAIALVSARAALATLAVSIGAALLAALYPAWRLARGTPAGQLRGR